MRKVIAGVSLASVLLIEAGVAASPVSAAPHCSHAYSVLQRGQWEARGFDATFYPAGGCGLTTTWGGYGRPSRAQLTVRGVQAGSGTLVVKYDFVARPDRVVVSTGDETLTAYRR